MRQQQPTNELTQCKTKRCSKCGIGKSRDEFCKDKANRDGLQSRCKHCVNIRNQTPEMRDYIKDYKQTPEVKAREKSRDLSRRYNLTLKSKEEMYGRQHGNCAGCRKPMTFEESVVDHCHATNAVRGLLHSHVIGLLDQCETMHVTFTTSQTTQQALSCSRISPATSAEA